MTGPHQKTLILDADQRSALTATRSLGRQGVPVVTAEERNGTLAGASKFCGERFVYPSPERQPLEFIQMLCEECKNRRIGVLLPMTEITTHLVLAHRDRFQGVSIPFASFEQFDALTNKWNLFKLAMELDIPVPKTTFIENVEQLDRTIPGLDFPVVLKPFRSRIFDGETWVSTGVAYVRDRDELFRTVTHSVFSRHPFLIQEYIKGQGCGVFALYDRGKPVVFFSHRRLREKPPSGGVSVLSESVAPEPQAMAAAKGILDHVKWHGLAMVELKRSESGIPYLMELNARFWGSLQLAVRAGVDFPWLLYQMATGHTVSPADDYTEGVKNRWLLGDLDSLYLSLRKGSLPWGEKARCVSRFCRFFEKNLGYEVNQWQDLGPFFFEIQQYIRALIRY